MILIARDVIVETETMETENYSKSRGTRHLLGCHSRYPYTRNHAGERHFQHRTDYCIAWLWKYLQFRKEETSLILIVTGKEVILRRHSIPIPS